MFETLSDRLNTAISKLSGRGRISDANVREAMVDVRRALASLMRPDEGG